MFQNKNLFLMACIVPMLIGCDAAMTKKTCATKETCQTDPNCKCWCSVKCDWRVKVAGDKPVYIENDPNGKFCYCNQWDYDHYRDNCIEHKHIPEPKNP